MDQKILAGARPQTGESAFVSKVYMWMSLGLATSAAASFALLGQPELLRLLFTNTFLLIALFVAEMGLVIWLSAGAMRMSPNAAVGAFLGYSFLNGLTVTSIFLVYTGASILSTFAIATGTFFFFSVYGRTTQRDLTGIRGIAMMGLIGVVIASLVNIFLKSSGLMWVTTFVGVAVFMALIAYDTQALKHLYHAGSGDVNAEKRLAVVGALKLYLDFINLFLLLLRLFGKQRN